MTAFCRYQFSVFIIALLLKSVWSNNATRSVHSNNVISSVCVGLKCMLVVKGGSLGPGLFTTVQPDLQL